MDSWINDAEGKMWLYGKTFQWYGYKNIPSMQIMISNIEFFFSLVGTDSVKESNSELGIMS